MSKEHIENISGEPTRYVCFKHHGNVTLYEAIITKTDVPDILKIKGLEEVLYADKEQVYSEYGDGISLFVFAGCALANPKDFPSWPKRKPIIRTGIKEFFHNLLGKKDYVYEEQYLAKVEKEYIVPVNSIISVVMK